jgi:hypothetical protein
MPRTQGTRVENNFIRGLITEASAMTFPENAAFDAVNIDFDHTGKAIKRKGYDLDRDFFNSLPEVNTGYVTTFFWIDADAGEDLVVAQIGENLWFWEVDSDGKISGNRLATLIDLDAKVLVSGGDAAAYPCSFATGLGKLFVAHPLMDPFFITYESGVGVTSTDITIRVRDFIGVDDTYEDSFRPNTLTAEHEYNLKNQGWPTGSTRVSDTEENIADTSYTFSTTSPITFFEAEIGDYPSNADVWHLWKDHKGNFNTNYVKKSNRRETRAPQGHYIINAYEMDRSASSGIVGLDVVSSEGYRPITIAFYAGRVWYFGCFVGDWRYRVYFSQIIDDVDRQAGRCFQRNAPTDEFIADILPNDGGHFEIPEIGLMYATYIYEDTLYILASNGIWGIRGSEGIGFTATDYTVRKISDIGIVSPLNVVPVDDALYFWGKDGIFNMAVNEYGRMSVTNISQHTIQSLYDEIGVSQRKYATGSFNRSKGTVSWVFRNTVTTIAGLQYEFDFTSMLKFDILSQAFSLYEFANAGLNTTAPTNRVIGIVNVQNLVDATRSSVDKILLVWGDFGGNVGWANQLETEVYNDWDFATGGPFAYDAYLYSGYRFDSEGNKKWQPTYVYSYFDQIDDSSCFLSGDWDGALLGSARSSNPQQAYKEETNSELARSRLKIRGHGQALRLLFEGEDNAPFSLLGWSIWQTGNTQP